MATIKERADTPRSQTGTTAKMFFLHPRPTIPAPTGYSRGFVWFFFLGESQQRFAIPSARAVYLSRDGKFGRARSCVHNLWHPPFFAPASSDATDVPLVHTSASWRGPSWRYVRSKGELEQLSSGSLRLTFLPTPVGARKAAA
jgi:hypothetical protein